MKNNENGFGAIEGLLIFVIVALIGGTGWYVWSQNQNKPVQQTNTNTQKEDTSSSQTYKNTGITFEYPKDWQAIDTLKNPANQVVDPAWLEYTSFYAPDNKPENFSPNLTLQVTKDATTYEQALEAAKSEPRYSDVNPMEVDGIQGFNYIVNYEGTSDNANFFLDGKIYRFTGGYDAKAQLLDILQTLKNVK